MSTSVFTPRLCGHLVCGLFMLASLQHLTAGRLSNCTHPLVQEHGGFRCDPSPCRGFPQRTTIHMFCEPGFHLSNKVRMSRCRHGRWVPPIPACVPVNVGTRMNSDSRGSDSMGNMVTTAVGVSILLLSTTACLVVKSGLYPCQTQNRRRSDQLDLMVEGLPVSLPSYEEAVYGSWGQRLASCSTPGPTQLLLAQEASGPQGSPQNSQSEDSQRPLLPIHSPDQPPPPYEEVQSHRRDRLGDCQLQVALSDNKNS
ncbi:sushi domain-containing protein 6 isoform X1 [Synchiropus splendidus]|uniref:sushi domain-containing protein 6 isoform X1 n=1 Tax=Synchiropus splendidus TaxID=270530 RepID=UPI00237E8B0D|nr:sushi domain-containing protein 6 isoform X1 [Synchiropus splendidus]